MYSNGQGVSKNQKEAVNWYRKASEQGDADSQYHLGLSYQDGLGVDKDMQIALDWYRKSAKSNYREAQHKLGKLYEGGIGVKKNIRTAANWYKKASTGGLKDASQDLNRLVGNISPKAVLIGFDSYDELPNIQGQKESINKLVDTLKTYNQFGDFTIVKRNDNPADVIKREIDAKLATQLVVFLSGHALEYDDGKVAIATPSTNPETPARNSLLLDQLSLSLNALPDYTSTVVIVDCFKQPAEGDETVGVDNLRILEELDSIKNVTVIAASSGEQYSHNVPDSRRNIFVESLCKGLQGAADEDENKIISSEELHLFLLDEVQDLAGNHGFDQAPEINAFGEDHPGKKLFDFRKPKPFVAVKLNNESKKKDYILHVRHQGKSYELPGRTYIELRCQSVSDIEYFAGKFDGESEWRKLYPAPTRSYTFRTTKRTDGEFVWTAGFYNSLGVHMTLIYPGSFQMGFNQNDRAALTGFDTSKVADSFSVEREVPAHTVKIDRPFYIGTYEITYGEFEKFVVKNGYRTDAEELGYKNQFYGTNGDDATRTGYHWRNPGTGLARYRQQPVVHITWKDTKRFCDALSTSEKASYALPTETQWEYAARGGTQTAYWNGNNINRLTEIANVRDQAWAQANNDPGTLIKTSDGQVYTAVVGSYPANPFGLHDVHGNVWEWCRNECHDYPNPPVINDGDGL